MIKCEVIKEFTLEKFDELKKIQRKRQDVRGTLFVGDTFECDKEMYDYLNGGNDKGKIVVKVIEIKPEIPHIVGHRVDDIENITPLSTKEELEKLGDKIEEYVVVQPKSTKKKKSKK